MQLHRPHSVFEIPRESALGKQSAYVYVEKRKYPKLTDTALGMARVARNARLDLVLGATNAINGKWIVVSALTAVDLDDQVVLGQIVTQKGSSRISEA